MQSPNLGEPDAEQLDQFRTMKDDENDAERGVR